MDVSKPAIVLTDPAPVRDRRKPKAKNENCPHCGKGPEHRKTYRTLAGEMTACVNCGHELEIE